MTNLYLDDNYIFFSIHCSQQNLNILILNRRKKGPMKALRDDILNVMKEVDKGSVYSVGESGLSKGGRAFTWR